MCPPSLNEGFILENGLFQVEVPKSESEIGLWDFIDVEKSEEREEKDDDSNEIDVFAEDTDSKSSKDLSLQSPKKLTHYEQKIEACYNHQSDFLFTCESCGSAFTSLLYLHRHRVHCKKSRAERGYVIMEPSEVTSDVESLAETVGPEEVNNRDSQCKTELRGDMEEQTVQQHSCCSVCDKPLTDSGDVKSHSNIYTGEQLYMCDECYYSSDDAGNLKTLFHDRKKVYACCLCNFKTSDSSRMKSHSLMHSRSHCLCCSFCAYKTVYTTNLSKHMRYRHADLVSDRRCRKGFHVPQSCSHCQFIAKNKSGLSKHMKQEHSDERIFSCTKCKFKAMEEFYLTAHMQYVHSD